MRKHVALFLAFGAICGSASAQESPFDRLKQANGDLVQMLVKQELLSQDAANLLVGNPDQTLSPMVSQSGTDALQRSTGNLIQMLAQKDIIPQDTADSLIGDAAVATPEMLKQRSLGLIDALQKNGTLTADAAAQLKNEIEPPPPPPEAVAAAPAPADAAPAESQPAGTAPAAESRPAEGAPSGPDANAQGLAGPRPADPAMKNLVAMLVQKGVITQDAANQLLHEEPVQPGEVRVPYVPQVVREQMKDEIKQEVIAQAQAERWGDPGAMPGWLSRISWNGDFRVRMQRDSFPSGNATPAQYNPAGLALIANTTDTHDYLRLQARLGMNVKISYFTKAGFRITTGTTSNPVSTNQTMGGSGNFNKYSLVLDRAYIESEVRPMLKLIGGKMPNPWLSTDLVWSSNVNFEGLAAAYKPMFSDEWNGVLTAGAFPVQDIERSTTVLTNSKWLYGAQAGGEWTAPNLSTVKFGVALYDFVDISGSPNTVANPTVYNQSAASTLQKGNSLMNINQAIPGGTPLYGLASKFRELNLTGKLDLATFDPVHITGTVDYVKNLGFDGTQVALRQTYNAGATPGNVGYMVKLGVGMPEILLAGDWQADVAYKYLESDAVLDALTDSDFHLGGTNAKGFIIGGSYGVDDNTWLSLRWLSTDQISGYPLSIDTLQLDLNTHF